MGCGPSSLKGDPVADIGSAPIPAKPRKASAMLSSFSEYSYGRQPNKIPEKHAERPQLSSRRESKAKPYYDANEENHDTSLDHTGSHGKYHSGDEHTRYRDEQRRNSLARYHSGAEHAKYRSEHEAEHARHEQRRKSRRADEGLSDEQTGFISSADLMVDKKPAGETRRRSLLERVGGLGAGISSGDGRPRMTDEELMRYTGKTSAQLVEQGRRQQRAPDQLTTWGIAGGGGGGGY